MNVSIALSALVLNMALPARAASCGRALSARAGAAALVVVASTLGAPAPATAAEYAYDDVADQPTRANPSSGWVAYPDFPHLEIVKDGTRRVDPELLGAIKDERIRKRVEGGQYTTLDLRNLTFYRPGVRVLDGTVRIPFGISLKHTAGDDAWYNPDKGTINVDGEIWVQTDGTKLIVKVVRFADSRWSEWAGRRAGLNDDVDADFVDAVVGPVMEYWFGREAARRQQLLSTVDVVATPTRP